MNKNIYGRLLLMSIVLLSVLALPLRAFADRPIAYNALPKAAQSFIAQYFPGQKAVFTNEDHDDAALIYEVKLASGVSLEFNSRGQWTDVDGNHQALPTSFLPASIQSYLKSKHADESVMQVESKRRVYKIELSSGIEVIFNAQGKFLRYDD